MNVNLAMIPLQSVKKRDKQMIDYCCSPSCLIKCGDNGVTDYVVKFPNLREISFAITRNNCTIGKKLLKTE